MAFQYPSVLLLIIVILLVAVEYSSATCGAEGKDENEPKFLPGRKLLQVMEGKSIDTQEKSKSADVDNLTPVPQMESDHIQSQNEGSKDFVGAADEVATLMRKDYKGEGRPRRKPPINNHEPNH